VQATRITILVFSEDEFTPDRQLRAAQEAFRLIDEENVEVTGGYVSSVTPIDLNTVEARGPEPRASRK
jgi:hypothetical protein